MYRVCAGNRGTINITEMQDGETAALAAMPFDAVSKGHQLEAVVVGCRAGKGLTSLLETQGKALDPRDANKRMRQLRFGKRNTDFLTSVRLQLSAKASVMQQARAGLPLTRTPLEWADIAVGQPLTG